MPTERELERMVMDMLTRLIILEEWRRQKDSANTRSSAWLIALLPVTVGVLGLFLQWWLNGR